MTSSSRLTPVRLRVILGTILVVLMLLGIGVFLLGNQQITSYSLETQQVAVDAQASNSKVQRLITTKKELEENASIVSRASQLVSVSKSYLYQDQIIRDINSYASAEGIVLESITFDNTGATVTPTATPSAAPAGIKTTNATIALRNPVNYMKFLRFIHSLEQSLFRMSVLGVGMAKPTNAEDLKKDPEAMIAESVIVEVYIK